MNWVIWGALALIVMFGSYARFAPVTDASGPGRPETKPIGAYPSAGGVYAVREGVSLDALKAVAAQAPRTRELAPGIYVTRSRIWGFPDITHIWEEGGLTHISAHLVMGKADLGAN